MSRRGFIGGAAAGAAALILQPHLAGAVPAAPPFTLGVASGDPLPTSVVIWTRLAPDPLNGGGMGPGDEPVGWEVASDSGFASVVASGTAIASAEHAHSVHVDVAGLEPDNEYWYRFSAGPYTSPVGRTRTAPASASAVTSMRFGFGSCQSWTSGYYTAHEHLAAEPLDVFFWLGDYIYEGGGSGVRAHNSAEVYTLEAYRSRYALYKSDPNLQAAHAAFPWVVVWDDHEVDNNYAGATDQDGTDPATFLMRRAAAYKAWWEHQPVRMPPPTGPDLRIYRELQWGTLASFFALDTRQYRSDQACGVEDLSAPCPEQFDPSRSILGADQEQWLIDGLKRSATQWNVIAQQVVFTAMPLAGGYNQDQWDGYPVTRQRIVETMAQSSVRNPLVVTGDIHAAGVGEVHLVGEDPSSPYVATELVGTSISSNFDPALADIAEAIIGAIPWVKYVNVRQRGYTTVELTRERMTAQFRTVSTVEQPQADIETDFVWTVEARERGSGPAGGPVLATPTFTG
ncbi:MAG: alkaline phosphatase D family protein [Acidimicrobiales bacterium]|nr:alkaline phosphatase D family protein [Acidimicrobiales bacterium]